MNLTLFGADAAAAVCLDASPSGFYMREGARDAGTVVWLQEGGSCFTRADCQARAATDLGSSRGWAATYEDESNMLSTNATTNPDFWDWTHVFVPYCSGDNHWGQGEAPHGDWNVTFAGHHTLSAVLDVLDVPDGSSLVLAGSSAGAVGVWSSLDFVADRFPAATVAGVAQGGYFWENVTHFGDWQAGLDAPVVNPDWESLRLLYEAFVDSSCAEGVASDELWTCLSFDSTFGFVDTPLFVASNWWDAYQLFEVLGLPYAPLDSEQTAYAQYVGEQMRSSVQQVLDSPRPHGLFFPSCVDHVADLNFEFLVHVQDTTMRDAISQWFAPLAAGEEGTTEARYLDDCTSSPEAGMPCNMGCQGLPQ